MVQFMILGMCVHTQLDLNAKVPHYMQIFFFNSLFFYERGCII